MISPARHHLVGYLAAATLARAAFAVLGALNAPFVTATMAGRSAYAPPNARAQIFVTAAGLKVAAGSAGTAAAGALVGAVSPRLLMLAAGALVVITAVATALDRRLRPSAPNTATRSIPGG